MPKPIRRVQKLADGGLAWPEVLGHNTKFYWISACKKRRLYLGDCLDILKELPADSVDLVFADPPYNIGKNYDVYVDDKADDDYLAWCLTWMKECWRALKPTGSIYVAIGPRYQAELKRLLHGAKFNWRSTIIWHFTFGNALQTNWTPSWTAVHYFTKGAKKWLWNKDEIRVPSARQLRYNDRRANSTGKIPDNLWVLDESTRLLNTLTLESQNSGSTADQQVLSEQEKNSRRLGTDSSRKELSSWILPGMHNYEEQFVSEEEDCWLQSRICGTFKEKAGTPNQIPLPILERIVKASSNGGDLVLDPFSGSGTTGHACKNLGRRFIGIELSEDYLKASIPRLE